MRFLIKVTMPVEGANKAVEDGSLGKTIQSVMEQAKPEAAYFLEEDGYRTAIFVVDMQEASQIPSLAEPFFLTMNARVQMHPVMTIDDLARSGLSELGRKWGSRH